MIVWLTKRYIEDSSKGNRGLVFSKIYGSENSKGNRLGLLSRIAHNVHTAVSRGLTKVKGIRIPIQAITSLESSIYMWGDPHH